VGQSKTVVLSTHILQEVEHMCDRVLIIHHGRIVRDATLAELQADGGLEKAFRTATQA
jgi:ABC-2 type transport system ATP-binding protein